MKKSLALIVAIIGAQPLLTGCENADANPVVEKPLEIKAVQPLLKDEQLLKSTSQDWEIKGRVYSKEAVIPPQCYTKTEGRFNPCMTCHQTYLEDKWRPNYMMDAHLQGDYSFSDIGTTNHWKNLFVDRREMIAKISDDFILDYIGQDNYQPLKQSLEKMDFKGFIPQLENYANPAKAFDAQGFAKDGSHWVAFNYKPLPSTFWPTNGSTDDVLVRLPAQFRQDTKGQYSRDVYMTNLALLEMAIQRLDKTTLPEVNEKAIGVDLNGDGELTKTDTLIKRGHYVGQANQEPLRDMLYPKDIEFLHSVRYVGVNDKGDVFPSTRMKELRYMKKEHFKSVPQIHSSYENERLEKIEENLPSYPRMGDKGLANSMGWLVLGFIEGERGELRPQTFEETSFCMGCHTSVGTTIDQTFAFPRKVTGKEGWKYMDLKGMKDVANLGAKKGEILDYLTRVGGGDEFRQNDEMLLKWFDEKGQPKVDEIQKADVYELITPSRERALKLNKAYYTIVQKQNYIFGRDANITPAKNVYQEVDNDSKPLELEYRTAWDIRLDWK